MLKNISFLCMQSHVDASRIIGMGADTEKVVITGNIKFDQQIPAITTEEKEALYKNLHLRRDQRVFISGSTHRGEEEIILEIYEVLKKEVPELVLIIATRHPERFGEVEALIKEKNFCYTKKTDIEQTQAEGRPTQGNSSISGRYWLSQSVRSLVNSIQLPSPAPRAVDHR